MRGLLKTSLFFLVLFVAPVSFAQVEEERTAGSKPETGTAQPREDAPR